MIVTLKKHKNLCFFLHTLLFPYSGDDWDGQDVTFRFMIYVKWVGEINE